MYLANLNHENKKLFLELAYHLASSDGDYSESEQAMISCYCDEMHLPSDFKPHTKSVDDVISRLNILCTDTEKKIIIFEAIGLALADSNYDKSERAIVSQMCTVFGLEESFSGDCERILNEYIQFQNRVNKIVLG